MGRSVIGPAALILLLPLSTLQVEVHYIHWNASNPRFSSDSGEYVVDVDLGDEPWQYHQANIICPFYPEESSDSHRDVLLERYVVRNVTSEEYEQCRLSEKPELRSSRIVAVCNSPRKLSYFTMTFRKYSPTPNGFVFAPGRDYYLISTSSKDDLYGEDGGGCSEDNMRLRFRMRRRRKQEREGDSAGGGNRDDDNQVPDMSQEEGRSMKSIIAESSGGGGRFTWTWTMPPLLLLCVFL